MPKGKENNMQAPKKKKKANGYKFPEPIPFGFTVTDTKKKGWKIGESIGCGGFAEVYSANESIEELAVKSEIKYPFAIKIEPKENGPLFCEMHFYMRAAKQEDIDAWKKEKKLSCFGMAPFLGSGSFDYKAQSYRFLVTERFGRSLYDIISENNNQLPVITALQIGVQTIDLLEYIHNKGYINGDIKAANLLLGLKPGSENVIHIVDHGLAKKINKALQELPKDPKQARNGTIEYISRDGHAGVFGTRGDLEMLGFNLLHWINSTLPWEKDIADPVKVEKNKMELMKSPLKYIEKNLPKVPAVAAKFLEYVNSLKNNEEPDYNYCRKLFVNELKKSKCEPYGKLQFKESGSSNKGTPKKGKQIPKRQNPSDYDEDSEDNDDADAEVLDVFEESPPKRSRRTPMKVKPKENANAAPTSKGKEEPSTSSSGNVLGTKRKAADLKDAKKKTGEPTLSWRDAPTAVASCITKAGEYKKNAVPYSKRVVKLVDYVGSLKRNEAPDYYVCRKIFCRNTTDSPCSSYDRIRRQSEAAKKRQQFGDGSNDEMLLLYDDRSKNQSRRPKNDDVAIENESYEEIRNANSITAVQYDRRQQTCALKRKCASSLTDNSEDENYDYLEENKWTTMKEEKHKPNWTSALTVVTSNLNMMKAGEYKKNPIPYSKRK